MWSQVVGARLRVSPRVLRHEVSLSRRAGLQKTQSLLLVVPVMVPVVHLAYTFCTRLSWVAPDAVVQRAMRHSSPETKRHYQLGMVEQVRQNLEKANEKVYGNRRKVLHFYDSQPAAEKEEEIAVCK